MNMEFLVTFTCVLIFMSTCLCVPHEPRVVDNTDTAVVVSEDTPIGTILWTIKAADDDGDDIIIGFPDGAAASNELVVIRQTSSTNGNASADIILNRTLDRDYSPDRRTLRFIIRDNSALLSQIDVVVDLLISDVNDEVPVFQNIPYRLEIAENTAARTAYHVIRAVDPDTGDGGKVAYAMQPITQSLQDAELFQRTFSMDIKSGAVTLTQTLDYENIEYYQFTVIATDGYGLNSSEVLTIRILDIQDTPPDIQGTPYVVTIQENIPIGSHFFTVRAIDGDRGIPNDVHFLFNSESPCVSLFAMNIHTGEITVTGLVDRDRGDIDKNGGVCDIQIKVREVDSPGVIQHGQTVSMATLSIFVTDENDNHPIINEDYFSAYIDNSAQLNYPVKFENDTEIVIIDDDQGSSGILELILRDEDGGISYDFEPIPSVVASEGRPIIALKSPDLIRRRDEIKLKLYAVERDTLEHRSATTVIHIRVIPAVSTTPPTTAVPTTTQRYKDPYIPSILGAIFTAILLIWAAAVTWYYCLRRRGLPRNNRISHREVHNGHPNIVNTLPPLRPRDECILNSNPVNGFSRRGTGEDGRALKDDPERQDIDAVISLSREI